MNFWTWVALLCGLGAVTIGLSMVATWLLDRRAFRAVDADMAGQGYTNTDDPDQTSWIPVVPADEVLDHGDHSRGVVRVRFEPYSGRHHLMGVS